MSENNQNENLHIGIDVGSTTVKLAILDDADQIRYAVYRRHHADVTPPSSRCCPKPRAISATNA